MATMTCLAPVTKITLPRLDKCMVGRKGFLEQVVPSANHTCLLALCDGGADAGRRKEAAEAGARGANPFSQRALRHQFDGDGPA